jgi:hypothetical protein
MGQTVRKKTLNKEKSLRMSGYRGVVNTHMHSRDFTPREGSLFVEINHCVRAKGSKSWLSKFQKNNFVGKMCRGLKSPWHATDPQINPFFKVAAAQANADRLYPMRPVLSRIRGS